MSLAEQKTQFGQIVQIAQKYLINTIFDTVNSLLGVVIGLYFADEQNPFIFIMAIISTGVALGISSGTSIYEAESLEQKSELQELNKHLATDLTSKNPMTLKKIKRIGLIIGLLNFFTPLLIAIVYVLLISLIPSLAIAFWSIIGGSIFFLFGSGVYFGKKNNLPPLKQGLRMLLIGTMTFVIVYAIGVIFYNFKQILS